MINWQNIDTVMLDMDGTLLDLHYDNHFWMTHLPKRYAEIKGMNIDDVEETLAAHIESQRGSLNWYCLDYWAEQLQVDIISLKKETRNRIKERPYTRDFLDFLNSSGKLCYLVTNAHPAGVSIKFEEINIKPYFDDVISSHQFQQPKESLAFWQALAAYIDFDPARTLFIDDNLDVLNTAKAFGIRETLGIHQPDSQRQRLLEGSRAIHHFNEIMP